MRKWRRLLQKSPRRKKMKNRNLNVTNNCDSKLELHASVNNAKCGSIYRYLKRKRIMDTSTPVSRRRETKLIEDQEDSPVDRMDQDSSLSPVERTDGHDGWFPPGTEKVCNFPRL